MSETVTEIILALDTTDKQFLDRLLGEIDPTLCKVKVGKELFTCYGPNIVEDLQKKGFDVFVDLKFHDIPNTVYQAVLNLVKLDVFMLNVHATGGLEMMQKAYEAVQHSTTKLIAVTVLTSMNNDNLVEVGIANDVNRQVLLLSELTKQAKLHGVVSSVMEVPLIKQHCGQNFITVTPGIRHNSGQDDQKRVVTVADALASTTDYMVIGRSITQSPNPAKTLDEIINITKGNTNA